MTVFNSQDDVIQWFRYSGVRMEYDSASGRWSFPSNDLYDLLKLLQQIEAKPLAALEAAEGVVEWAIDHGAQSKPVLAMIREAMAETEGLAA